MKTKIVTTAIILLSMTLFINSCKKDETPDDSASSVTTDNNEWVVEKNKKLEDYAIDGFGYKKSNLPGQKWNTWKNNNLSDVKKIIDELPENYILQITGHADESGPEEPEGAKPGNLSISLDRAKSVFNALKEADVKTEKITYKGIGSSDLLSGYDSRAAEQRRVSFVIVIKE